MEIKKSVTGIGVGLVALAAVSLPEYAAAACAYDHDTVVAELDCRTAVRGDAD